MTEAGLQVSCGTSASSMRQSSITRTPFCGSVDWQSEAKTQELFPMRLSLLPMTKLLVPITVLLSPMTTLLYSTRQLLMVCSRVVTVTTCWQSEKSTTPRCLEFWHVTWGGAALKPPLKPDSPWNWQFWQSWKSGKGEAGAVQEGEREEAQDGEEKPKGPNWEGLQLKLRQREFLSVLIARFA